VYTIPNLRFDGFDLHEPCADERDAGLGVTSVSFAVETHMNRIAEVLGLNPWEFRRRTRTASETPGNGVVLRTHPRLRPLAAAERRDRACGELPRMTLSRAADLPPHLVAQQNLN
jgi:CO/xanthine dehydrogenase Mo-binding subunit